MTLSPLRTLHLLKSSCYSFQRSTPKGTGHQTTCNSKTSGSRQRIKLAFMAGIANARTPEQTFSCSTGMQATLRRERNGFRRCNQSCVYRYSYSTIVAMEEARAHRLSKVLFKMQERHVRSYVNLRR